MAKEGELEILITERREATFPGMEGEPRIELWISYRYGKLPPGLVRIPKEKWSKEEEARLIKADIQARLAARPEVRRI